MSEIGIVATHAYIPDRIVPLLHWKGERQPPAQNSNDRLLHAAYEENLRMHGIGLSTLTEAGEQANVRRLIAESGIEEVAVETNLQVSQMLVRVTHQLLRDARLAAFDGQISTFIVCQSSFEHDLTVSSACRLQCELKQGQTPFSVGQHQGASFLLALWIARTLMETGESLSAVVLAGAERWGWPYPRIIGTTTALGDGAGAVLLQRDCPRGWMLRAINVATPSAPEDIYSYLMRGESFAIDQDALCALVLQTVDDAGYEPYDIDLIAPHQLNVEVGNSVLRRCGLLKAIAHSPSCPAVGGYLCAAETPVRIHQVLRGTKPRVGQKLLTWAAGFSGALACAVLEYHDAGGQDEPT